MRQVLPFLEDFKVELVRLVPTVCRDDVYLSVIHLELLYRDDLHAVCSDFSRQFAEFFRFQVLRCLEFKEKKFHFFPKVLHDIDLFKFLTFLWIHLKLLTYSNLAFNKYTTFKYIFKCNITDALETYLIEKTLKKFSPRILLWGHLTYKIV